MIFHLLNCNIPPLDGVALRAIRAHFPLVDIGVAILTILAGIGKHRLDVALRAGHFLMHPTERITSLIMIELRNCPDGPPTRGRVAVLAGNGQCAVRTLRCLSLGPIGWRAPARERQHEQPKRQMKIR